PVYRHSLGMRPRTMCNNKFTPRRTVLIGDTSQERFNLLERILRDDFHLHALRFSNFNDLRTQVTSQSDWRLVLIADDMHLATANQETTLTSYFIKLEERSPLGCLVSSEKRPDLTGVYPHPQLFFVPRVPAQEDSKLREEVIN